MAHLVGHTALLLKTKKLIKTGHLAMSCSCPAHVLLMPCSCPAGFPHALLAATHPLAAAVEKGIRERIAIWVKVLGCSEALGCDLNGPRHFFSNPGKHFPDGDIYNTGADAGHD